MNRKQFLSSCGSGLCACTLLHPLSSSAADATEIETPQTPDDWRLPFVKSRYAKLLEIMGEQTDETTVEMILIALGRSCAGGMQILQRHKGDVNGFIKEFSERYHEDITYDPGSSLVTVVGPERDACFCPLVGSQTPACVCSCSLGWQSQVYETLTDRKVEVTLLESVQRGGKRCSFQIKIGELVG